MSREQNIEFLRKKFSAPVTAAAVGVGLVLGSLYGPRGLGPAVVALIAGVIGYLIWTGFNAELLSKLDNSSLERRAIAYRKGGRSPEYISLVLIVSLVVGGILVNTYFQ